MLKRRIVLCGVLVISVAIAANGQAKPDFSGTWLEDESQRKSPYTSPAGGGVRAISGKDVPVVIIQTGESIAIERDFIERVRHVHHFDGREDKNRNGAQVHTTRTRWEGGKLITEGTTFQSTSQGETYWKLKEVRFLTDKGELVLETTRVDEHGQGAVVRQVFKRQRR